MTDDRPDRCTILGIGNVLLGDEGIGVHVAQHVARLPLPPGVTCVDGGTGGLHLLGLLGASPRVVLVDATADGAPPGTVRRLRPRYSHDYPRTLTAHDIGLKDLLDAADLLGDGPDVTLFAVSIDIPGELKTSLSAPLQARVPEIAAAVIEEARGGDPVEDAGLPCSDDR